MAAPNSTTSDLLPSTQIAYKKKALERLVPGFIYLKLCQNDPESYVLPANGGRTATFYRYSNLAANTTPMNEVTNPTGATVGRKAYTAAVAEYGNHTVVPGMVKRTDIDPMVMKSIEETVADNAKESLDTVARDVISANAQVIFPNTKATGTMTAGDTFTLLDLLKTLAKLRKNRVPRYSDGYYKAILDTYQLHDLIVETTSNLSWRDSLKFNDAKGLTETSPDYMSGYFKDFMDCKIYQTDLSKSVTHNSIACKEAYILGRGGFGTVDLKEGNGFNVYVNYPSEGQTADPYRRASTIAWHAPTFAVANLDDNAAGTKNIRVFSLATSTSL